MVDHLFYFTPLLNCNIFISQPSLKKEVLHPSQLSRHVFESSSKPDCFFRFYFHGCLRYLTVMIAMSVHLSL